MSNIFNICIFGSGNMGGAIAEALSENSSFHVSIYDKDIDKAKAIANERKIQVYYTLEDAAFDIVLIAVKPQILPLVYPELRALKAKMYISIAAGVPLKVLEENLECDKCVRFMPNIAAKVKKAVTAVTFSTSLEKEYREVALKIATSFGSAFELNESLFSAFTGLSGSGIAYVFEFMHDLAMGAVKEGIPYSDALNIARDTIESATALQRATEKNAIELETMVCSAGGTTIEGVKALHNYAFPSAVMESVIAATEKSKELEKIYK